MPCLQALTYHIPESYFQEKQFSQEDGQSLFLRAIPEEAAKKGPKGIVGGSIKR
jgi:hypothetical protein